MAHSTKLLEKYEHARFGPVLGVSDEGSAAETIVEAAYSCAKARAFGDAGPEQVGLILDGERMGSAGEVPIGPPEYEMVLSAARDKTFVTTNVGVRVNTRFQQPLPEFRVADAAGDEEGWVESVFETFKPFLHTPDGELRPLTVRLRVEGSASYDLLRDLVPELEAGREGGPDERRLGPRELHVLSFLDVYDREIGRDDLPAIRRLVDLASELGVPEVALDGKLVEAARRRLSIQGVLNVLDPEPSRELLRYAAERGVRIRFTYEVDEETAARTVWTGLDSAYHEGLTAAKYGLVPLVFEQQREVVRQVQAWFSDWTPIPAFYVDTPLVTTDDVYESDRVVEAARMWMSMVAEEGAEVALVDAPDRIDPHRLLKTDGGPSDRGVLTLDQVETLLAHAEEVGLKVLWSGGISAAFAFELGKLGVFGFFTTGSTARVVPVHGSLVSDRRLAQQKEPTEIGVRRIHALGGGGFLCKVLPGGELRSEVESACRTVIGMDTATDECKRALSDLDEVMQRGWKAHWNGGGA